ncbi:MAG: tape measure protein [Methylibium sp.]|nr:tape measure protein [Methylibium sp.]
MRLIDKVSGPAKKAGGAMSALEAKTKSLGRESEASLGQMSDGTVRVRIQATKMDKAVKALSFVAYGAQAGYYGSQLVKMGGGMAGVKKIAGKAAEGLKRFGKAAGTTMRKLAPFAVGGAGLYGLGKVASTVAVPALGGVAMGMTGIAAAAGIATLAVGALLVKLGVGAVQTAADFAVFGQSSKFAFQQLGKYGASGAKLFEHATKLAAEFGLDVKTTTKTYAKFLALQFNPREADKMIKMGADMRALGGDAQDVESVFHALGKIKSIGRLQGGEILQLEQAGVSGVLIWEELAKLMGKSTDEVRKLQEAGKVSGDLGLQAIEQAINRKLGQNALGEAGKRFADTTIEGMAGQMKAKGDLAWIALGERLAPTLQRLTSGGLERLSAFLDSTKGQAALDGIGNAFDRIGDVIVKALPLVEKFFEGFGPEIMTGIEGFSKLIGKLGGGDTERAGELIAKLGTGLGKMVLFGASVIAVLVGLAAGFTGLVASVFGVADELVNIGIQLNLKAFEIGRDLVLGLVNGIKAFAAMPVNAIKSLIGSITGEARKGLKLGSPSKLFEYYGKMTGAGYQVGLEKSFGEIETANDVQAWWGPSMGETAAPAAPLSAAAGGGGVETVVHVTNHYEINGAQDPKAITDQIEQGQAAAMTRIFKQLRRGAGG